MRHTVIAILIMLLTLCLPQAAFCESDDAIVIEVTSMVASSAEAPRGDAEGKIEIDPQLSGLRKKLSSLFAYSHYAFLGRSSAQTKIGEVCVTQLPERFVLEVEPQVAKGGEGLIEMTVALIRDVPAGRSKPGRQRPEREIVLRTRIRLESGGTVLLGGPPIAAGVLILALSARR